MNLARTRRTPSKHGKDIGVRAERTRSVDIFRSNIAMPSCTFMFSLNNSVDRRHHPAHCLKSVARYLMKELGAHGVAVRGSWTKHGLEYVLHRQSRGS